MALTEIGARLSLKGQGKFSRDMGKVTGDAAKVERSLDKAGRAGERFGSLLGKAAVGAGAALAGGAVLAKGLLDTATNLESLRNKSKVVFGDQIGYVEKWAAKTSAAMGLTTTEATGLAAGIADLLVPIGFTRQAGAELSTELIGLSGALAQWSGGQYDATAVAGILQGAILGETDALKALGIGIGAADVEARLLSKGQEKLTGDARKQAEAQAIVAMIFEKSTDAQKAYRDGANKLGLTQATLNAKLKETRDRIATRVAPYLLEALERLNGFIPTLEQKVADLTAQWRTGEGAGGDLRRAVEGIGNAARDAGPFLVSLFTATADVVGFIADHPDAFKALTAGVVAYGVAMKAAAAAALLMSINGPKAAVGIAATGTAAAGAGAAVGTVARGLAMAAAAGATIGFFGAQYDQGRQEKAGDLPFKGDNGKDYIYDPATGRYTEAPKYTPGTPVRVDGQTGGGRDRRRHGGPVRRDHGYTVGEAGREQFVPRQDGFVVTQQQAARAAAAPAPMPMMTAAAPSYAGPEVVQVVLDGRVLTEAVLSDLRKRRR